MGKALANKIVSLSLSPPNDTLQLGYLPREFDALAFELTLQIIRQGGRVLYGGHLHAGGMTLAILEHMAGAYRSGSASHEYGTKPVVNLLAASELRKTTFSDLTKVLKRYQHFVELRVINTIDGHWSDAYVVPQEDRNKLTLHLAQAGSSSVSICDENQFQQYVADCISLNEADALSAMRLSAAQLEHARLVAGGRRGDTGLVANTDGGRAPDEYSGLMPGIYEETIMSLPRSPVALLAAWGGAAREAAFDIGLLTSDEPRAAYVGEPQPSLTQAREQLRQAWAELSVERRDEQAQLQSFVQRDDVAVLARDLIMTIAEILQNRETTEVSDSR